MNLKKQFPVPIEVYSWLRNEKLGHLEGVDYRFIVRIIDATFLSATRKKSPFVYVHPDKYKSINIKELGVVSVYNKPEAERSSKHKKIFIRQFKHPDPLFHAVEYEAKEKKRKFLLELWFDFEYMPRLKEALTKDTTIAFVNLYNGRAIDKRSHFTKECKYRPANTPFIRNALKQVHSRPFNKRAILDHLKSKELSHENAAKFLSDIYCWMNINLKGILPIDEENEIYSYTPSYRISASGRVAEVGGGFQSCSKEMKQASVLDIENIYNYDLKSSQVNGLKHQFKLAGLNTEWIDRYVAHPNSKQIFADNIGVSVECWKECLLMIIMGSSTNLKKPRGGKSGKMDNTELYESLKKELKGQLDREPVEAEVNEKRLRVLGEVEGLLKPLRQWRYKLKNGYYLLGDKFGRKYNGEIQIKNYLGISYYVKDYTQAQLAARILQGQEAAFIHLITKLSEDYSYKVVGNEHDGIITIGAIPEEAIDRVKEELNIKEYDLVQKLFL